MQYLNGERPEEGTLAPMFYDNIEQKATLYESSYWRYVVRSIYAAMYLAFGTTIAMMTAQLGNQVLPGSGKFLFAFFFAWTLVMIVYMHVELGTANMLFMTVAVHKKYLPLKKALSILMTCVLFNLIGDIICAFIFSQSAIYQNLPSDHFLFTAVSAKFTKSAWTIFIEGIFANIIVATSLVATTRMKNADGRVWSIIFIIFIFAFCGFEHVIANFVSFPMAFFANGGPVEGMTLLSVAKNYVFTFLGNYVGGGLLIGWMYSWFSERPGTYID